MDITQIKDKRAQLQQDILELIREYEEETGMVVDKIYVDHIDTTTYDSASELLTSVSVEARLPEGR